MKKISKIINILILVGVLFLFVTKAPSIFAQFKSEGTVISDFSVLLNSGDEFNSQQFSSKKVLIFWATWCPPCELELSRVNDLVKDKRIPADSVLAISINEDKQTVDRIAAERGYQFQVGYDFDGQVAKKFAVTGTPTVVFLNGDKTIRWMTTGLSPLLKLRLNTFLD
ncbi:MAG: TlpA disulfide reductase family protein [Bdellovibrionota bacterium]